MKKSLVLFFGLLMSGPVWADGYWVGASGGYVPTYAYQVGVQPDGEPLFLCKGLYNGTMYMGNLDSQFGGCDITVNGNVLTVPRYSVWVADIRKKGILVNFTH